jgi:hypothetical protein
MLTDREADEIERGRRAGVGGPLVLKWLDQLLADRRERVLQIEHLRRRLNQAFRYLDGLVRDVQRAAPKQTAPAPRPVCPKCGKPYARASGESPNGIVYVHADGRECRSSSSAAATASRQRPLQDQPPPRTKR